MCIDDGGLVDFATILKCYDGPPAVASLVSSVVVVGGRDAGGALRVRVACLVAGLGRVGPAALWKPKQQADFSPNPVAQGDNALLCNIAAESENRKN